MEGEPAVVQQQSDAPASSSSASSISLPEVDINAVIAAPSFSSSLIATLPVDINAVLSSFLRLPDWLRLSETSQWGKQMFWILMYGRS